MIIHYVYMLYHILIICALAIDSQVLPASRMGIVLAQVFSNGNLWSQNFWDLIWSCVVWELKTSWGFRVILSLSKNWQLTVISLDSSMGPDDKKSKSFDNSNSNASREEVGSPMPQGVGVWITCCLRSTRVRQHHLWTKRYCHHQAGTIHQNRQLCFLVRPQQLQTRVSPHNSQWPEGVTVFRWLLSQSWPGGISSKLNLCTLKLKWCKL